MSYLSLALSAFIYFASSAQAQTGPYLTELSKLPVIQKLEQTPGWGRLDSEVAIQQIVQHLKEKGEYAPIDCAFQISNAIQIPYGPGEVRSDVENKIRRQQFGRIVLLTQYQEWKDYPAEAPGFQPQDPANPDWIAFLNLVAPQIAEASSSRYPGAGLRKVVINGYQSACRDIKSYLQARFKVTPDQVSCIEPHSYETMHASDIRERTDRSSSTMITSQTRQVSRRMALDFYKLDIPHADGLQYQPIQIIGCTYQQTTLEEEKLIDPSTAPKQPEELKKKTSNPPALNVQPAIQKPEEKPLTRAQEKQRFRDWQRQQDEENRKWIEQQKLKDIELQKQAQARAPRFVSPNDELPVSIPQTVMGRALVKTYQEIHGTPHRDQTQLNADEQKLEVLKKTYEQKEKDDHQKRIKKDPDNVGEMTRFDLDPAQPFDAVSVLVDVPLYQEELPRLLEVFQERNPGWMFGCRVRSLIRQDRSGNVLTEKTTIECLVPRFMVWYRAKGEPRPGIEIPIPVLGEKCKLSRNSCGVVTGSRPRVGILMSKLEVFKRKAKWETLDFGSRLAKNDQNIIRSIEIEAGLKGTIVCAFTKKPILNALALIHGKQDYSMNTDAGGNYLFNPLVMKGLEPRVYGSHRYYHPNSKPFGRLKIFDVTDIGPLELEPKRVTIRGTIGETFTPRYGSGLEGIVVQIKDYPQFSTVTKADGSYEIKNVPAILTDLAVTDPTGGHEPGKLHFTLDPDQDNLNLDLKLVPRLTIVKGRVHISNGRGAANMKVQIPEHPELFAITDAEGNYEIKDVPYDVPGLMVYPDPLGDHDGKSEALNGLSRYTSNTVDVLVKYNRCDVSGQVVDLVTLAPIPGAKVWIEGAGKKFETIADENGNYEIRKIPLSSRRLRASTTNNKYFPSKPVTINPQPAAGLIIENQEIRMMPKNYTTDRIVIVLTWNKKQPDLDSQLYVPGKIRLYFANHNDASLSNQIGGYLDVDDTGYGGRETTIIELEKGRSKVPGVYRFMVYQFADIGLTFEEAGAEIDVYKDGQHWAHMTPPPGRGLLWYALAVDDRNVSVKNLIRNYPEFKEYSTLSKEYGDYDRKIRDSESQITAAKRRYEMTVEPLTRAKDELDSKLNEQRALDLNPPQNETPAEKKARQDAQVAAVAPLQKNVAHLQRVHDTALASQDKKIAEHQAYLQKVEQRKESIKARLEVLGNRLGELLNNPY
jgi:hypothetical protein